MAVPDFSSDFGKRALEQLESESIIWLTTVNANGAPQPSPVWFLWQDDTVLIYSQPDTPKIRAITGNARVTLNFNSTPSGGNVVIFRGEAELVTPSPPANNNPTYIEKYQQGISGLGSTPEDFAAEYSTLIRVTLTGLRGF